MTAEQQNADRKTRRARIDAICEERGLTTLPRLFDRVRDLAEKKKEQEKPDSPAHNAYKSISKWIDDDFYKCLNRGHGLYNECLDLMCEVFAILDPLPLPGKIEFYRQRIWYGENQNPPHIALPAAADSASQGTPPPTGWEIVDRNALAKFRANAPTGGVMAKFFDGVLPNWNLALAEGVQSRGVVDLLADRFRAAHIADKPRVVLLAGAGGEGKSTAILQVARALIEDAKQGWTCLHRQAANEGLPEDTFAMLEQRPDHAWIVVIDDADNIGSAILAAVKKVDKRPDVHLLLAARAADWHHTRLVPGMWDPSAKFHLEPLAGLDEKDAGRIVAGWMHWNAMGKLSGSTKDNAVEALLRHARDFATRKEAGELLGALLMTRQGTDMRAHVRTLIGGLGRNPVIGGKYNLRDVYAMVAAMHAENQLYLSRHLLAFALGSDVDELQRQALTPLQSEAMLDSGAAYVLTRHRRIAEAACEVMREDGYDVDRWFSFLTGKALRHFKKNRDNEPNIEEWNTGLANHFLRKGERGQAVARSVAEAAYIAEPDNHRRLTVYTSVLRRTGHADKAMTELKATGEKHRNRRDVLNE